MPTEPSAPAPSIAPLDGLPTIGCPVSVSAAACARLAELGYSASRYCLTMSPGHPHATVVSPANPSGQLQGGFSWTLRLDDDGVPTATERPVGMAPEVWEALTAPPAAAPDEADLTCIFELPVEMRGKLRRHGWIPQPCGNRRGVPHSVHYVELWPAVRRGAGDRRWLCVVDGAGRPVEALPPGTPEAIIDVLVPWVAEGPSEPHAADCRGCLDVAEGEQGAAVPDRAADRPLHLAGPVIHDDTGDVVAIAVSSEWAERLAAQAAPSLADVLDRSPTIPMVAGVEVGAGWCAPGGGVELRFRSAVGFPLDRVRYDGPEKVAALLAASVYSQVLAALQGVLDGDA